MANVWLTFVEIDQMVSIFLVIRPFLSLDIVYSDNFYFFMVGYLGNIEKFQVAALLGRLIPAMYEALNFKLRYSR